MPTSPAGSLAFICASQAENHKIRTTYKIQDEKIQHGRIDGQTGHACAKRKERIVSLFLVVISPPFVTLRVIHGEAVQPASSSVGSSGPSSAMEKEKR